MKIPLKTLDSGFSMPVYGLGTWMMGGRRDPDPNNDDDADINAVKAAIEAGVTHIDTAEIYAAGHSEELVGEAIKDYERKKLFIATKAQNTSLNYDGVLRAAENSLERLGLQYVDLFIAHAWSELAPVADVMRAMDRLMDEGTIKNIGVSNYNSAGIQSAMKTVNHQITSNQVHYNVVSREPERDGLLHFCQKNDVLLVAWRPVEKGNLLRNPPQLLQELADKYDKTPAQIAINWLISQPNVVTLSKTRNPDHLKDNLGAIGWTLEEEDIERIRNRYPGQRDISDTVPLAGE